MKLCKTLAVAGKWCIRSVSKLSIHLIVKVSEAFLSRVQKESLCSCSHLRDHLRAQKWVQLMTPCQRQELNVKL